MPIIQKNSFCLNDSNKIKIDGDFTFLKDVQIEANHQIFLKLLTIFIN